MVKKQTKPTEAKLNSTKKSKKNDEKEVVKKPKNFLKFIKKNQFFFAIVLLALLLAILVVTMFSMFNHATDSSQGLEAENKITFDEATIEKIKELDKFNYQAQIDLGQGRTNPFESIGSVDE